jgi:hypothetical protein
MFGVFFKKLPPNTLAGFDLSTQSSNLLGGWHLDHAASAVLHTSRFLDVYGRGTEKKPDRVEVSALHYLFLLNILISLLLLQLLLPAGAGETGSERQGCEPGVKVDVGPISRTQDGANFTNARRGQFHERKTGAISRTKDGGRAAVGHR